jgi:hypothetical protein
MRNGFAFGVANLSTPRKRKRFPFCRASTPAATAEGHICGRAWKANETVEDSPAS